MYPPEAIHLKREKKTVKALHWRAALAGKHLFVVVYIRCQLVARMAHTISTDSSKSWYACCKGCMREFESCAVGRAMLQVRCSRRSTGG